MGLSEKKERFCREYVIDHNGTRAATEAGWNEQTASSAASRLLKREEIAARIGELESDAAEACGLTAIGVLRSIMETRDRCMTAEAVKKYNKETREYEETGEYVFDSAGANRANELLGKHLGMFEEKLTATCTITERDIEMMERMMARESE